MFTKPFLVATAERAVKTFAQVLVALLTTDAVGVLDVDWTGVLSAAALAALVSVLSSVGTGAVTDGSPSAGDAETLRGRT